MKEYVKKIHFVFFILLLSVITASSCKTLDVKVKSSNDGVLYVMRQNSAFGNKDKVILFLNGRKAVEMKSNTYLALHLKPGKYTVRWEITDKNGKKQIKKYAGVVQPGVVHETVINFAFGNWRSFEKITPGVGGKMLTGSIKLEGELDLRSVIKPR